jgi:hypothetical protein
MLKSGSQNSKVSFERGMEEHLAMALALVKKLGTPPGIGHSVQPILSPLATAWGRKQYFSLEHRHLDSVSSELHSLGKFQHCSCKQHGTICVRSSWDFTVYCCLKTRFPRQDCSCYLSLEHFFFLPQR